MNNNQINSNQMNPEMPDMSYGIQQGLPNSALPFNGDAKNFHANIPEVSVQIAQQQMQANMQVGQYANVPVQQKPKKKHTALLIAIIAIAVVAIGGSLTYFLMLTPQKRFERAMNKADAAFEDGNYSIAISNYEKALDIYDDEINAMYHILLSEQELKDDKSLKSDYRTFRKQILSMDLDTIKENSQAVVAIFLMSQEAFADDLNQMADELEMGAECVSYDVSASDNLWTAWVQTKIQQAAIVEADDREAALEIYSEALDKRPEDADVASLFADCWKSIVDEYLEDYSYEPAQALWDKYQGKVSTINFTDYQSKINYAKTIAEQGIPLMKQAYEAMESMDYNTMCDIDLGDELGRFLAYVNGEFVWTPDGFSDDYTGKAIGLYKHTNILDETESYFYFGDYVNGERNGDAVCFFAMDGEEYTYELFAGAWKDNQPNGYGIRGRYHEKIDDGEYIDTEEIGNFVNGFANGDMTATITSTEGYTVEGTFHAVMGDVPDVQDQYPQYDFPVPEGRKVYVVLEDEEHTWWLSNNDKFRLRAAAWIEE